MNWYDMPEGTKIERAEKEISECNYCINGLVKTMKQMGVSQEHWGKNVIIQGYLERIEKAREILQIEKAKAPT